MPHTLKSIKEHAFLNPAFLPREKERAQVRRYNAIGEGLKKLPLPKMVNRYVPHYGAKEQAKYAARAEV